VAVGPREELGVGLAFGVELVPGVGVAVGLWPGVPDPPGVFVGEVEPQPATAKATTRPTMPRRAAWAGTRSSADRRRGAAPVAIEKMVLIELPSAC
jgi:hypothetical protein